MTEATSNASYAYDLIDRYLRNNMDDDMYAEYSDLLGSVYAAPVEQSATPEGWRSMDTAPKDGTMLRLLVEFTEHPTEDADHAPTIGANNFDNDGEDRWQFAGWCWTHDHFVEGKGEPIGWLPMLAAPVEQSAMVVPEGYALVPLEPTEAMIDVAVAYALLVSLSGDYNWSAYMRDVWLSMLAAAPAPEPASDVLSDDDRDALHQLAFELGGTDSGEYLLDASDLNKLIDAATPEPASPWISVEDRLPESERTVLAFYLNSHGKGRRVRAEYIAAKTKSADDGWDSDSPADYDEQADEYFWPAGWYEVMDNWDDLTHMVIHEGEVTHWMPLPAAPEQPAKGEGEIQ